MVIDLSDIIRSIDDLTTEELRSFTEEVRNLLLLLQKKLPAAPRAPRIRGVRIAKKSSSECSAPQRELLLGSGGSGLFSIPDTYITPEGVCYNQAAVSQHGSIVLSNSTDINCKQHAVALSTLDKTLSAVTAALALRERAVPFLTPNNKLPAKHLFMRRRAEFKHLPISDTGELQLYPPYYPNRVKSAFYLEAVPWQRNLSVLDVLNTDVMCWLCKQESITYLVLQDHFRLSLIPLKTNDTI